MFRLLIVARTEDIAKQAAEWAVSEENKGVLYIKRYEVSGHTTSLIVRPLWIGQKARWPAGDGLLLVAKEAGDLQAMGDFIFGYKKMPIKFVLYDGAPSDPGFEAEWDAKSLLKGNPIELVEKLIAANNDVVKRVAKVFQSIDTNKTGVIHVNQVNSLIEGLELEFGKHIYETSKELALKLEPGFLSLEAVMEWWKSGKGDISIQLIGNAKAGIEANKAIKELSERYKEVKIAKEEKFSESKLSLHCNRVETPGVSIDFNFKTSGNSLNDDYKEFGEAAGAGYFDIFLTLAFHTPNPSAALIELQEIVTTLLALAKALSPVIAMFSQLIDISFSTTADKVCLCIKPSEFGGCAVEALYTQISSIAIFFFAGQRFESNISFNADLDKFATEEKPMFEFLLDGMSVFMDYRTNSSLIGTIRQIYKTTTLHDSLPAMFKVNFGIGLYFDTFVNSAEAEIEFEVTQEIKEAIAEAIGDEKAKMSFKTFKEQNEALLIEKIESLPFVNLIHGFFKNHVTGFDTFFYFSGYFGTKLSFTLPGLSTLLNL